MCFEFQVDFIKAGGTIDVTTTTASAHDHTVSIKWGKMMNAFLIRQCDDKDKGAKRCWDKHPNVLVVMPDQ